MSQPLQVSIEYPNGVTDNSALVTPLGEGRYRLELDSVPELMAQTEEEIQRLPRFLDTIEAKELGENKLKFIAVTDRAKLKRFDWSISKSIAVSEGLQSIFAKVTDAGGHWEQVLIGIVIIAMPMDSNYDPSDDIERLLRNGDCV